MRTMTMTGTREQRRAAPVGVVVLAAALASTAWVASAAAHEDAAAQAPAAHATPATPTTPAAPAPHASAPQAPAPHAAPSSATPTSAPAHDDPAAPATHGTSVPADTHTPTAGDHGAAAPHGAAAGEHDAPHGESLWVTLARVANFAILVGVISWLARKPLADHLAARGTQIRKDLVDAAELRATATARLQDIEAQLAALPGELEQLRTRGAEELASERARLREAATTERDRLVQQARREIASQARAARGQLRAHAASLAVDVAESRLRATLTPAEQAGLVDHYAAQMRHVP
jgi:F0F1-type ATP synthase membrane subunit b/b'